VVIIELRTGALQAIEKALSGHMVGLRGAEQVEDRRRYVERRRDSVVAGNNPGAGYRCVAIRPGMSARAPVGQGPDASVLRMVAAVRFPPPHDREVCAARTQVGRVSGS